MVDWSTLTVPEVVGFFGLGATFLAIYKGVVDAKKATMPTATVSTTVKETGLDLDKRYLEAMEALAAAQAALASANTRVAEVNGRQAIAMEGIGVALANWIHKYERDKDEERLEVLETRLSQIYNMLLPPEARGVRPHSIKDLNP